MGDTIECLLEVKEYSLHFCSILKAIHWWLKGLLAGLETPLMVRNVKVFAQEIIYMLLKQFTYNGKKGDGSVIARV